MGENASRAFELRVGPYQHDELVVARLRGREALSRPFVFDVDLAAAHDEPIDARPLLDASAVLLLRSAGGERAVNGIVSRIEERGFLAGRWRYRLRIVPRLARLALTRRSRQFHGKTAPAIVQEVLRAGGVAFRAALQQAYSPRELCVQYRESDLAFVSRLLEAEGISYFLEHGEDGHTLVLGDSTSAPQPLDGGDALPFRERSSLLTGDHVFAFEPAHALRSTAASLADHDFVRPGLDLVGKDGDGELEDHDPAGEVASLDEARRLARVRLEGHAARAGLIHGQSQCTRLVPGATFELGEHPHGALNQAYQLVEVVHRGDDPDDVDGHDAPYDNEFRCLPAGQIFRPPPRTPRPRILGVQTARVVGAAGEEIHTDEHARVRVRFHWDRDGQASTWVRVSQAWAGAGWGALFLPRIGMEVVLRFEHGNPDRPLVVGTTYNGAHPPPVALPAEKHKSVLRSASSPGPDGGGHNELTFDDAAGSEQIFVHAQKDESIVVENDKHQSVLGFDALRVGKDRSRDVAGQQILHVGGDDAAEIDGSQSLGVRRARTVHVGADHRESVGGNASERIALARFHKVGKSSDERIVVGKELAIGGAYNVDAGGIESLAVAGALARNVGAFDLEVVAGSSAESVGGDRATRVLASNDSVTVDDDLQRNVNENETSRIEGCQLSTVGKPAALQARLILLEAEELALVLGGETRLLINKAGTLKISARNLQLEGESKTILKGAKIKLGGSGSGSKKKSQDALDGEQATRGPKGRGGNQFLSPDDAAGFEGLEYEVRVLKKDLIAYRLHDDGGGAYPLGKWVSATRHPTGLEGKLSTAQDPAWGNQASKVAKIHLPAGTRVFEGPIAAQGGGAYASNGTRLCVAVPRELRGAEIGTYLRNIGVKVVP